MSEDPGYLGAAGDAADYSLPHPLSTIAGGGGEAAFDPDTGAFTATVPDGVDVKIGNATGNYRLWLRTGGLSPSSLRVGGVGLDIGADAADSVMNIYADAAVAIYNNQNVEIDLRADGGLRLSHDSLAFFGGNVTAQQEITGSRGANAALASLLTALAAYGLIVDSSS